MNYERKSINGYRFYIKDGKYYISNTSIGKFLNKPILNKWQLKQALGYVLKQGVVNDLVVSDALQYPQVHLMELAAEGTKKHKMMETYLRTKKRPKKSKWMDLFENWQEEYSFKTKDSLIERTLFNAELGVAGTADIIGKVHGLTTLIDLKTSTGVYLSHLVQVCGYKLMLGKSIKLAVLQIARDAGSISFHILDEVEEECCTTIFCALLDIFKAQFRLGTLGIDIPKEDMVYFNKGV